jgi:hypothetical protein
MYTVKVSADDCAVALSDGTGVIITSLTEEPGAVLKVYPNPASSVVTINLPGNGAKRIEVATLDGSVIHRADEEGTEATLDVAHFATGVYIITVKSNAYLQHIRFVRK